ncbi:MAG: SDR family NAD(P)-dependent oxidoreductase [Gemmatimonadales bacterium]
MRNVIVTGGSRGLGLGIARTLRGAGYHVIAIARKPSDSLDALASAGAGGGSVEFKPFDLEEIAAIPALVKMIHKEFGPIYGLVNNAAIGTSGLLATMPDEAIERLMRLNTLSPIIMTKYVVRSMMAHGGGRIVNISSIVSSTGFKALTVYGATKSSLIGFTRSLAREVGPLGINVNAVAPGFMDTAMTDGMEAGQHDRIVRRSPLQRLAEAEDVAGAVEFLLSERARNITGTTVTVDAGSTA